MRFARLEIAASVKRAMLGEEPGRARPPKVRSGAVFGKRETLPYNTCDVHNAKLVQHVVNLNASRIPPGRFEMIEGLKGLIGLKEPWD